MPASWKTSQGPAKSIMTAPSEITNATGMLPSAGGLRRFAAGEVLFPFGPACDITAGRAIESGKADANPNAAAPLSNSLLFMAMILLASLRTGERLSDG